MKKPLKRVRCVECGREVTAWPSPPESAHPYQARAHKLPWDGATIVCSGSHKPAPLVRRSIR